MGTEYKRKVTFKKIGDMSLAKSKINLMERKRQSAVTVILFIHSFIHLVHILPTCQAANQMSSIPTPLVHSPSCFFLFLFLFYQLSPKTSCLPAGIHTKTILLESIYSIQCSFWMCIIFFTKFLSAFYLLILGRGTVYFIDVT